MISWKNVGFDFSVSSRWLSVFRVWFWYVTDLDGNAFWDPDEVKALFLKELDKMYTPGAAEDDMRERIEELERMREHVFKEADTNNDGLIRWWDPVHTSF